MRLIDANALKQHFTDMQNYEQCAANFPDHRGEPSTNWYCVEQALENAPTIDAIPVEWLEQQRKCNDPESVKDINGAFVTICIDGVLVLWQKEKEAR